MLVNIFAFRKIISIINSLLCELSFTQSIISSNYFQVLQNNKNRNSNIINEYGYKLFSQSDEDGITYEILNRIGYNDNEIFIEIGVGNLLENNTLSLLIQGKWQGFWIDKKIPNWFKFFHKNNNIQKLNYLECEINDKNIILIINRIQFVSKCKLNKIKYLSIDIDSNEFEIIHKILEVYDVDIIVTEFNGKYGPNSEFKHGIQEPWNGLAYQGSSIRILKNSLITNYSLVGLSISGVNAFFVKNKYRDLFIKEIESVKWFQPNYQFTQLKSGHNNCKELVQKIILYNEK